MAKGGKQSIRRLESQGCFLRARWQLLVLSKLAAGWAELPCLSGTSHASQCTLLRAAHRTLSVHVCLHVKACTTTASPKTVPVQVHVPTQSCMWASAGRRAKSHSVCLSGCEILQQKSLARHVESFGGWHISAHMSVATKTYYRAVTEAYLLTLVS